MLKLLLASVGGAMLVDAAVGCAQATTAEREAVVSVIRRSNEELPKAIANWDTSGLHDYLIDRELVTRKAEITLQEVAGTRSTAELRSFEVRSVEFAQADQAIVRTQERWFETRNEAGTAKHREYDLPQGYLLRRVDGRWYIAESRALGDVPEFSKSSRIGAAA
jgi:hypothetical protein